MKEPKLTAIIPIFGDPDRDRHYVQRTSGGVVSAWQRGSISRFHLWYGNHGWGWPEGPRLAGRGVVVNSVSDDAPVNLVNNQMQRSGSGKTRCAGRSRVTNPAANRILVVLRMSEGHQGSMFLVWVTSCRKLYYFIYLHIYKRTIGQAHSKSRRRMTGHEPGSWAKAS